MGGVGVISLYQKGLAGQDRSCFENKLFQKALRSLSTWYAHANPNKKWKPTCAWTATSAMHPFKKVADWIQCHDATVNAFGS